jgi:quinol monooxygenase YgiN
VWRGGGFTPDAHNSIDPEPGSQMTVTSVATFTMRAGREAGALRLIRAVERQAKSEQRGTLVYLAHRTLDKKGKLTRTLYFYERYRSMKALKAHLASSSWQAVVSQWTKYFEGPSADSVDFFSVHRIAAFERAGSIPTVPLTRKRRP